MRHDVIVEKIEVVWSWLPGKGGHYSSAIGLKGSQFEQGARSIQGKENAHKRRYSENPECAWRRSGPCDNVGANVPVWIACKAGSLDGRRVAATGREVDNGGVENEIALEADVIGALRRGWVDQCCSNRLNENGADRNLKAIDW